jgi:hypothetical protein
MCTKCRPKFVCAAGSTLASPRQACPSVGVQYGHGLGIAYRKEYAPMPNTAFLRRYWQQRRGLRSHLIMLVLAALLPLVLFSVCMILEFARCQLDTFFALEGFEL